MSYEWESYGLVVLQRSEVPPHLQKGEFFQSLSADDDEDMVSVPVQCFTRTPNITCLKDAEHLLSSLRFWMVEEMVPELIEYFVENRCKELDVLFSSFMLELTWLKELLKLPRCCSNQRLEVAMKFGLLGLVQKWHEAGYKWSAKIARLAAEGGHLACLQYAFEHGCTWDSSICIGAARNGHLSCLQYAHEHGCPWDGVTCNAAAEHGHLSCLQYAHIQGCPWDVNTCAAAAGAGQLLSLQYAHLQGCAWNCTALEGAARNGHYACLEYAYENGCSGRAGGPLNSPAIAAAKGDHLDCLQLASQKGCPLAGVVEAAAAHDSVTCLAYALQQGEVAKESAAELAAKQGHLRCLQLLHESGCLLNVQVVQKAAMHGHLSCLRYLAEHSGKPAARARAREAVLQTELQGPDYAIAVSMQQAERLREQIAAEAAKAAANQRWY